LQNTIKETYNPQKYCDCNSILIREILKAFSSSNTAPDEDEAFFISIILAV